MAVARHFRSSKWFGAVKRKNKNMDEIMVARKAILADLKARAISGDKTVRALDESNAHRWHKPQDNYYSGGGEIPCPVCTKGKLRYSRSGYNGHVHGRCSTDGCVAWME